MDRSRIYKSKASVQSKPTVLIWRTLCMLRFVHHLRADTEIQVGTYNVFILTSFIKIKTGNKISSGTSLDVLDLCEAVYNTSFSSDCSRWHSVDWQCCPDDSIPKYSAKAVLWWEMLPLLLFCWTESPLYSTSNCWSAEHLQLDRRHKWHPLCLISSWGKQNRLLGRETR